MIPKFCSWKRTRANSTTALLPYPFTFLSQLIQFFLWCCHIPTITEVQMPQKEELCEHSPQAVGGEVKEGKGEKTRVAAGAKSSRPSNKGTVGFKPKCTKVSTPFPPQPHIPIQVYSEYARGLQALLGHQAAEANQPEFLRLRKIQMTRGAENCPLLC